MQRDPITQELIKNALATIADNMVVTVVRTARSQVVKQSMDFSTAICDAEGQMVTQGLSLPVHMGAVAPALEGCLKCYGDDIHPGDILINNDPYEGGSHLPDIFLFKPVFSGGSLLAYLVVIAHQVDIGGRVAGGNACDSTEIYQEGLRIPPLKLFEKGELNQTLYRIIRQNVRLPETMLGDLWAQVAAVYGAERELLKLKDDHGIEDLKGYMDDLIDYTERLTRNEIAALPQGEAEFTDYVDDDGLNPDPIKIHVKLTIKGDEVHADFTGTSPQCKGAINTNFAFTKSVVYAAIRCLLSPELPNNAGYFRPISVSAPEGSYVNALHPAPVAARALGGFRVMQTVFGALAQIMPDRIPAAWGSGELGISIAGYDRDRKPFLFVEFHNVTGTGGGPHYDGVDGGPVPVLNLANTPVELMEAEQPFLVEEYGLLPDTGGAGKYRGALGVSRQYRILAEEATVQVRSDRRKFQAYGLEGGKPGAACNIYLNPETENRLLPTKWLMELKKDTVVRVELSGAGGYGDPFERDANAVARDVQEEKLSLEVARRDYGVALDPETLVLDWAGTEELRGR